MVLPRRTFSADVGQKSTGSRGPDQLEADLDALFRMMDPADNGIGTDNLVDSSVTTSKIADLNVTEGKLVDSSVTSAKLADGSVIETKLGVDSVTTSKIADLNVTEGKLADGSVTTIKIANGSVDASKIAAGAVITTAILDGNVTESKLDVGAVTQTKIGDGAVATAKLADDSITKEKVNADVAGAGMTQAIDGSIGIDVDGTTMNINASDKLEIKDSGVSTAKIANTAVTTDKLADSSVTTIKISDANVTEGKIADSAVTNAKIAPVTTIPEVFSQPLALAEKAEGDYTSLLTAIFGMLGIILGGAVADDLSTRLGRLDNLTDYDLHTLAAKILDLYDTKRNVADSYTKNEIDNAIVAAKNAVISQVDRKEPVATFADLSTTYPTPEAGWIVLVKSSYTDYVFNGVDWLAQDSAVPFASETLDGIISSEDYYNMRNISTAWIANQAVNTAKIADSAIATAKIADSAVTTPKIADANITTEKLHASSVTTQTLYPLAVTTEKIADDAVTRTKIDVSVAGSGLIQNTDGSISPSTDLVSVGVVNNQLAVKDSGISTAKLADGSVTYAKLDSVNQSKMDNVVSLQQAFAARNVLNLRSAGRKMSTPTTVNQLITSLSGNADGRLEAVVGGRTATNLVKNGNFADTSNWNAPTVSTISVANNVLTQTSNGSATNPYVQQTTTFTVGHKLYARMITRVTNAVCASIRLATDSQEFASQSSPVQNTWYKLSGIITNTSGIRLRMHHYYADAATGNGQVMETREIMVIDLTAMFGAGNEPDVATCDKMFANWFDGTKSVQAQRVKVTGKNLFGGSNKLLNKIITSADTGLITNNSGFDTLILPVQPGETYTYKYFLGSSGNALRGCFYNGSKDWLSGIDAGNPKTVIIPENAHYIGLSVSKNYSEIAIIEHGPTATTYEPYTETVSYIPGPLRSLPNGVRDEINLVSGQKVQRVSGVYTLQASDVIGMFTAYVNLDCAKVKKPTDFVGYNSTSVGKLGFILEGYSELDKADSLSNIGTINLNDSATYFMVDFAKGTTLEQAQAALVGKKLIYQLATPITTQLIGLGQLDALPYGSIIIEPVVRGVKRPIFGSGNIKVTTADAPISAIESVYRIDTGDDGLQTKVDVTSAFTVDADKLGITCATADSNKPYEYVCTIDSAYSTVPQLQYSYPEGDDLIMAIASHNYNGAAADWVLTSEESKCGILVATNAGGAANIILPDRKGKVFFINNKSGQTLTAKGAGATSGTTIPNGNTVIVFDND